jgi:hypothetical protein
MVKQIKKLTMLFFVAATMFSFSSCSKDDDNKTASDAPETVADTEWMWRAEDPNSVHGVIDVSVDFNGPKLASLDYTDMSTGIMQCDALLGTYEYSDGEGKLLLKDDNYNPVNIAFTVNKTTMTLKFKGVTYTLTKQ